MEFKNLIDVTPEIEGEARKLLEAAQRLQELLGEQKGHFDLASYSNGLKILTIYDRSEYSRDGLGTCLGFFVHRIHSNGEVVLDFVPENTEEAKDFYEEFEREYHKEDSDER